MKDEGYYEFEWDSNYCYPNCFILKNKLNIKDKDLLEEAERQLTAVRILDLKLHPIKGNLDFQHLLNIHQCIFKEIYSWAGKTRSVNIAKGNGFCNYIFINDMAQGIFSKIQEDNYLLGLNIEQVITKLSYYLGELNAMHPFREGNGRTQRVFIEYLAQAAGYYVDFSKVSSQEMIEASVDSMLCNYEKMENLFRKSVEPISPKEQEAFIKAIATPKGKVKKAFENMGII